VALNFQALSRSEIPARDLAASIMRALEFDRPRGRNPFRELTDVAHDLVSRPTHGSDCVVFADGDPLGQKPC
jgi:hypothetical protein